MSYTLTFTRHFKDGLAHLPTEIFPILDRQLKNLETDPFTRNPNAKPMRNVRNLFRMRIGIHVRLLYKVCQPQRRVDLWNIGTRESIYARAKDGALVSDGEALLIRKMIGQTTSKQPPPRVKPTTTEQSPL
ncbi:MAG: hypothetical protein QG602_2510, partial [Verrucomicrobiota bacterium]|nr:hypothetical protein [Verrucomicrobiota bacterium]